MGTHSRDKFEDRAHFNESLKNILLEVECERIEHLSLSEDELKKFASEQATLILKNLYKIPTPQK